MKTRYELLHYPRLDAAADTQGSYETRDAAMFAAGHTDPDGWLWSANGHYYRRHPKAQRGQEWLIWERQTAEIGADRIELALEVLTGYGQIDGAHHKMWVIDQAVRALSGDGYDALIVAVREGLESEPATYDWDTGVAP